jgi:peptide-methionine (S)-S-oxide reductase
MVELLIRHGALEWQPDRRGRTPLAAARRGSAADKRQIAELLDRPVIRNPGFRAAIEAIRRGDAAALGALLDAEPRLLEARIEEPDCYRAAPRHQYFLDPKLFWFVANNPGWMKAMPPNIVEIAETMIARGVGRPDLDYALELVMTSASARQQGLQQPLTRALLAAGGTPSGHSIELALAHGELEPVRALVALGQPMTAPIAAAFGETAKLRELLGSASDGERQSALAMAVINGQAEAAAVALAAGADPNRFMPVHAHSTPLHHAVLNEDLASMKLLVDHGARSDVRDLLWKATPLEWAVHEDKPRASAWLEALSGPR